MKLIGNYDISGNYGTEGAKQVRNTDGWGHLGSCYRAPKIEGARMGERRSEEIIEQEIPRAGKRIQKAETYNKYGDSARMVEIGAFGGTWNFCKNSRQWDPDG